MQDEKLQRQRSTFAPNVQQRQRSLEHINEILRKQQEAALQKADQELAQELRQADRTEQSGNPFQVMTEDARSGMPDIMRRHMEEVEQRAIREANEILIPMQQHEQRLREQAELDRQRTEAEARRFGEQMINRARIVRPQDSPFHPHSQDRDSADDADSPSASGGERDD